MRLCYLILVFLFCLGAEQTLNTRLPQAPNLVSEHKVVVGLRHHGQYQVADAEGNFPDVSA